MSENSPSIALREEALTPLIYSLPSPYSQARAWGPVSADKRIFSHTATMRQSIQKPCCVKAVLKHYASLVVLVYVDSLEILQLYLLRLSNLSL